MSFIHIDPGPEPAGERHYFAKIGSVAFHRENAINNDNTAFVRGQACKNLLEVNHVVMAEPERAGKRGQAPIKNGSVNITVSHYHIALLSDRRQGAEISLKPGAKNQRRLTT